MSAKTLHSMRELDSRHSDGMSVRLFWCPRSDRLTVAVDDERTDQVFSIELREGALAMDAFRNPYAYAELDVLPPAAVEFAA
jgi:hypothetical protein